MIFGHNTNVKVGDLTFHVQTEDRGESHALIDTTVYYRGRVLHRRTHNYYDLTPLNEDRLHALKLRLDDQHRVVLEEMRSGKLHLAVPATSPATIASEVPAKPEAAAHGGGRKLVADLLNPKSWLSGKRASLLLAVKDTEGTPVSGAQVSVHVEGAVDAHVYNAESASSGQVKIEFDMPKMSGTDAALVIRAEHNGAAGQLRFALKAKPKVTA